MPLVRRKKVVLHPIPDGIEPHTDVFYLERTGEIFTDYESYAARMTFYKMKTFQCEVTGKGGLDYFQAVDSERAEARTMHARFPESLKPPILRSVQWQIMGRLDHLVELVYDRFKDRYFPGENVFVDVDGEKCLAHIKKVYRREDDVSTPPTDQPPHVIGTSITTPLEETLQRDDPMSYVYILKLLEDEMELYKDQATAENNNPNTHYRANEFYSKANGHHRSSKFSKHGGTEMHLCANSLSRDRLSFSKSILRRFIRDCVDRDAAVASPWTVKGDIASLYGIESEMPENVKRGIDGVKKGEKEKRKKVWVDKNGGETGPPKKKARKMTAEERAANSANMIAEAERKAEEEARERERIEREKEEEKKKKAEAKAKTKAPPIKYPTEDLDVLITDREKKQGKLICRPELDRAVPFSASFERFLMTWMFMISYGQPLALSPFTLDDYEHALRHSIAELPCTVISEIHVALLNILKERPTTSNAAVGSLMRLREEVMDQDSSAASNDDADCGGVSVDELLETLSGVGNNWAKTTLKEKDGRKGWEDVMIGCLKDYATTQSLPGLRSILTRLLFGPSHSGSSSSSSSGSSPTPSIGSWVSMPPSERYALLPPGDKISIISFLCDLCLDTKLIHQYIDEAESTLTEYRKERIEVNRERKRLLEEIQVIDAKAEEESAPAEANTSANIEAPVDSGASDAGSEVQSDAASVSSTPAGSTSNRRTSSNHRNLLLRSANSRQREAARIKAAEAKAALAERRRMDEEVNKLEKRLDGIEREFRKFQGVKGAKPMGYDRFYNRIWWFDGFGGSGVLSNYGTGRVFIQGPSEVDVEILKSRGQEVVKRRLMEEGEDGMLEPGEWGCYSEVEQVEEFMGWLNQKGNREVKLKANLTLWMGNIVSGMKKRLTDVNSTSRPVEARRSTRTKAIGADVCRESYMLWTNRKTTGGR